METIYKGKYLHHMEKMMEVLAKFPQQIDGHVLARLIEMHNNAIMEAIGMIQKNNGSHIGDAGTVVNDIVRDLESLLLGPEAGRVILEKRYE